jgi:hypothetical protein
MAWRCNQAITYLDGALWRPRADDHLVPNTCQPSRKAATGRAGTPKDADTHPRSLPYRQGPTKGDGDNWNPLQAPGSLD